MKKYNSIFGVLFIGCIMLAAACKKDKDEDLDIETQSASDNYLVESQVNDALKEVDAAARIINLSKVGPDIMIDSNNALKIMLLDYHTGTLCADGKVRAGRIYVTWKGSFRYSDSLVTIRPDSFYQNGTRLEGTKLIKYEGRNDMGNLQYTITVNAKLTKANGNIVSWNAVRNREWVAGEGTTTWTDDVYSLTGTASGSTSSGLLYTANITRAVIFDFGCQYRVTSGTIELLPQGKRTRIIDYGNGTCDQAFTVTIGNKTVTVNK